MPVAASSHAAAKARASGAAHRFVSITDAANYLRCNHKLIRKMITAGEVTGYRLPGSKLIRIDLNELDTLLDAGRVA